jgi:hypothetical protein
MPKCKGLLDSRFRATISKAGGPIMDDQKNGLIKGVHP